MQEIQSEFQRKYPLSPKKFWKKMIGKGFGLVFSTFFWILFLGAFVFPILVLPAIMKNQDPFSWIWTGFGLGVIAYVVLYILQLLGWGLYFDAYIRRYFYSCDENFVTIRKGVFSPTEIHVQYGKIQDVYVDQDWFDRLLGLYDVHIASATVSSGIEAHIDGVDERTAEGLKALLLGRITSMVNGTTTPSVSPAPVTQVIPETPVVVPSELSIKTYPIESRWTTSSLISSVFTNLFLTLFIFIFFGQIFFLPVVSLFGKHVVAGAVIGFVTLYVTLYVLQMIGLFIWKANFSWECAPEYIVMKSGIIGRRETHVPYHTIQDVILSQGWIERLFGICNVRVENATAMGVYQTRGRRGTSASVFGGGTIMPGLSLENGNKLVAQLNEIVRVRGPRSRAI